MEKTKTIRQILLAIIPVVITAIIQLLFGTDQSIIKRIIVIIVSYALTALILYLIYSTKPFRQYRKYEGIWIQIIPDLQRRISVCRLEYKNGCYQFNGINYNEDGSSNVKFFTEKFVDDGKSGFFYITTSSQEHEPQGYGRVYSISNTDKGYYTAVGYFFDVPTRNDRFLYRTNMIKFDKKFYGQRLKFTPNQNPGKLSYREIFECMRAYINDNPELLILR
ncbi:MAG: hypothetical protein IKS19_07495 [Clostridia bacterium]|nr:hypothetical protein [Clostridia bacterium]